MTLSHDGQVELCLGGIKLRDAGIYTCVATNEVGKTETSAKVNVCEGPAPVVENDIGNEVESEAVKPKPDIP